MAYIRNDGKGPYPCHAGDFCGNYLPGTISPWSPLDTPEEAERQQRMRLAKMRFGIPRPCPALTVAERISRGYVGLYLIEDDLTHTTGHTLIDTPEELREPQSAEEYETHKAAQGATE